VTLEDIIEDLFADIYEEYGLKKSLLKRIDDHTLLISGKMAMDEFKDLTGLALPSEDFDTVGGFVFHLFGKLPSKGESVRFDDYAFRVERMGGTRILVLKVERNKKE
jgi:CBS domain containing-hemolysin-like protein